MLDGKVAIVTGAARGIGRGIAEALADAGANVVLGTVAYDAAVRQLIPMGREQTPADIAAAVIYLATARNVTGVALNVAGGMEVW